MDGKVAAARRPILVSTTLALILALPAAAGELVVPPGKTFAHGELGAQSETFGIPAEVTAALAASEPGRKLRFAAFPVAPGVRQPLDLERYDVYAPGARIVVVESGVEREVPHSTRLHFLGSVPGDPITRVGLSLDPRTGHLRGVVDSPLGELRLHEPAAGGVEHRIETSESLLHKAGAAPATSCANEVEPSLDHGTGEAQRAPAPGLRTLKLAGPTYSAVVAVDTDSELMDEKYGNDPTAATDSIADLFTEMNVVYERDASLRLLQGDTFLRPGSAPYTSDPWNVEGSGASSAQLREFGDYWAVNRWDVDRVFAMLLSGKSSSSYSASGIAWVNGYCSAYYGYSVTQIFTAAYSSARIVSHELGHNLGSRHTHCYETPVDQCYNAQSGCYSGPVSCPSGGRGTIMSYCHFGAPNGAACGTNDFEFDPAVADLFSSYLAANTPGCVEPISAPASLFADGFESGDMNGWS